MKESDLLSSLLAHTGSLQPAPDVTNAELNELRRFITVSLREGQSAEDIGAPISAQPIGDALLRELEYVTARATALSAGQRVRIARRDFGIGGTRTAEWAAGMQPSQTLGPFLDELGRSFWFDLFLLPKPFRVSRGTDLLLVLPIGTTKKPNEQALAIPAGTVWIRANQLTSGVPQTAWVGIRVKGGQIDIPQGSNLTNDAMTIHVASVLKLNIELDPPSMSGPASGPGSDATNAVAELPKDTTFAFGPLGVETIAAASASLSVYGNNLTLTRNTAPASFEPTLRMVLVPMPANSNSLEIGAVRSELFQASGSAPIEKTAWGIPVTLSQPENLGTAAGAGSLVLLTKAGLSGSWLGLSEGEAALGKVLLAVDPLSLILLAERTAHFRGQQRFDLWQESDSRRSIIDVKFPRPFFFSFVSGRNGLDSVAFQTQLIGHVDRPLRVDGSRFPVDINGTVVLLQNSTATTVGIEAITQLPGGFHPMAVALTNALVTITPVRRLFLNGTLIDGVKVDKGTLVLASGVYQVLPILPDPYAANFASRGTQDAPLSDTLLRATVTWPDPEHPEMKIVLDSPDGNVTRMLPEPNRAATDPFDARRLASGNVYWMLDVSSGADQLGVSLSVPAGAEVRPDLRRLTVKDLSIQFPADHQYTFLLPQFQWEPVHNTFNKDTGDVDGMLISHDDGGPSFVQTETVNLVPVAPIPLVREVVRSYNDDEANVRTRFTLPFGITASTVLRDRRYAFPAGLQLTTVHFQGLKGARQISLIAGRWFRPSEGIAVPWPEPILFGTTEQTINFPPPFSPPPDNTLGPLREDFNVVFNSEIPVQRIELSGYGASIFSRWVKLRDPDVGFTHVSFDAFHGRTAFERIQMVSYLWPCIGRVIRTIVLERQGSGSVLRWDSGWVPTTPGRFSHPKFKHIHKGDVDGMYNIREIRDTNQIIKVFEGTPHEATLQAVYYDADVAFTPVAGQSPVESGQNSAGHVPVRRQLGFIQRIAFPTSPPPGSEFFKNLQSNLLTRSQFDALLQKVGPLGGPIDCRIRIGNSRQAKRVTLIQVERGGEESVGNPVFAVPLYGSPVFAASGQWSMVRVDNLNKTVQPIDAKAGVPLIKRDGGAYRWADPEDLMNPGAAKRDYGLLMAHDTQRFLLQRPKIEINAKNISSTEAPRVADPYSMLESTGLFPRVDQAIKLPGAELIAETLKLATATGTLTASGLGIPTKTLLNLPAWSEKVDFSQAAVLIDSVDNWKIHLSKLQQKLEFAVLGEVMKLVHDFESIAGDASKILTPKIELPPILDALTSVLDMLSRLAPNLPGGVGPFKLSASFAGTTFRLEVVADFKLGTKDSEQIECGMGKVRGNLKVGAELTADIIKREIGGAIFLEVSGSWQQLVFPFIYGGGHVRFFIRGDHAGKTTLELDACTIGSIGGTLIPGLVDLEATVKYGYFIQVKNSVLPGVLVGMEGRAKLLSGLIGFKFGVEGRALIDPTPLVDRDNQEERNIELYGRIRVAGTVTVAWAIQKSKSFETDFNVSVNWKTALLIWKAGLLPVP